jgi:hypothetical protein
MSVADLKILLMEDQYPILTEQQLNKLATMYESINQACYMGCLMKAQANKITVGPISIENDVNFWLQLANSFKAAYEEELANQKGSSKSITGKCIGRSDE